LITGDEDGVVKVWDLSKKPIGTIENPVTAHKNGLMGIVVSPDGKRFATTSRDGQVRLWTWDEIEPKQLREWNLNVPVRGLAFLPGGKQLLAANADASIFVLDLP
jgi:WD40 repeat protein